MTAVGPFLLFCVKKQSFMENVRGDFLKMFSFLLNSNKMKRLFSSHTGTVHISQACNSRNPMCHFQCTGACSEATSCNNTLACSPAPFGTSAGPRGIGKHDREDRYTLQTRTQVCRCTRTGHWLCFLSLHALGHSRIRIRRKPPFRVRRMEHFVSQFSCQHVLRNLKTSTVMLTEG